jgi:alanyl-tRNA synthetase
MSSNEIRAAFIDFFKERGHTVVPSSPLIPFDDPTLLFTSAGMVQFKKYWATSNPPPYTRAVTCQKSMRAGGKDSDIELIGTTGRHHTFFEMLGNFSFGDYFKKEAIAWAWEFSCSILKLNPDLLSVSYYREDLETKEYWRIFLPEEKIIPLGKKDNFWGPAGETGACGPCTELYYDFGSEKGCGSPTCGPGCDCDRFLEFWNLVFPHYDRQLDGSLKPLAKPGVDTGMGLERISRILQETPSNYETDLFLPLIEEIASFSHSSYQDENIPSFRIIADHARAALFAISDGVIPHNEGRGYVLRRIIRRGALHGNKLGINEPFLFRLTEKTVHLLGDIYPELKKNQRYIEETVKEEEEKFSRLLSSAKKIFSQTRLPAKGEKISGETLFLWYDTYGIPKDLLQDLAEEKGIIPDWEEFDSFLAIQRRSGRAHSTFNETEEIRFESTLQESIFTGYHSLTGKSILLGLYYLPRKEEWKMALDSTPFYPEKGGQVGDKGSISGKSWTFIVTHTHSNEHGVILHSGYFSQGNETMVQKEESVNTMVDEEFRRAVSVNHTATHLLHYCLRQILGKEVRQAGSWVGGDRFRFDFFFPHSVSHEKIERIEEYANQLIIENIPVSIEESSYDEAVKKGAIALFHEKYGEKVRTISFNGLHTELCGGTHISSLNEIILLIILSCKNIGENLRRIEAITRKEAWSHTKKERKTLTSLSELLETSKEDLIPQLQKILSKLAETERAEKLSSAETVELLSKQLESSIKTVRNNKETISFIAESINTTTPNEMGKVADLLVKKHTNFVVILSKSTKEKTLFLCKVSPDIAPRLPAVLLLTNLLKKVQGSGGGKEEFAQGSSKNSRASDILFSELSTEILAIIHQSPHAR